MIKILFICHGNICRSTMAEYVLKKLVKERGYENEFIIASAATSTEEIGNDVHPGTKEELQKHNVPCPPRKAVQMKPSDYQTYDYLIGMDTSNLIDMEKMVGDDPKHKIVKLLDFTDHPRSIADPWYTGNFTSTYQDVEAGCEGLLCYLQKY